MIFLIFTGKKTSLYIAWTSFHNVGEIDGLTNASAAGL